MAPRRVSSLSDRSRQARLDRPRSSSTSSGDRRTSGSRSRSTRSRRSSQRGPASSSRRSCSPRSSRWRGTSLRITRSELAATAFVGALLLGLGVGLVHVAETRIDSSVAAMIAGTVPLQIIVLRLVARREPGPGDPPQHADRARSASASSSPRASAPARRRSGSP